MKISIAIPTWESRGRGVEFLDDLLRTISVQTFKDYDVVISDHSVNDDIKNYCQVNEYRLPIIFYRNQFKRGNHASNTNQAIEWCRGDIIKVMFQDDFFYDDEALEKIHDAFDEDTQWLVCGTNHTKDDGHSFYRDLYPEWNDGIINGINTISSPSVLAARRKVFDQIKFDDTLVMMMDCEFYYHTKKEFGDPIYYNDVLVTNRVHSNQISSEFLASTQSQEKFETEIKYCKEKHLE